MLTARYYAELNDFLPPSARFHDEAHSVQEGQSVESFLRQQGIPLAVVDLVLVNGASVAPGHPLHAGDRLSIYPVFESFDIGAVQRLRPGPLRTPRFVLDVHLGKLATLLRMLGFDALYRSRAGDEELVAISKSEGRALLSRDRKLVARPDLERAYRVRHQHPDDQLVELLDRFQLDDCLHPFTRCLCCNAVLEAAPSAEACERVPPRVRQMYREFWRCPSCRRIYWRGSHYERMRAKVLHLTRKT